MSTLGHKGDIMYKYEIIEVTKSKKIEIQKFYNDNWGDYSESIKIFMHKFIYIICTKYNDEIVGMIPIIKLEKGCHHGEITDNHYQYFLTLIHSDYRNIGICNGILRMAIKLLIEKGADKIRVAKSSLNDVKHTIFTDLGFKVIRYDPEAEEYKHIYELDVNKADMNKLNNAWKQYDI